MVAWVLKFAAGGSGKRSVTNGLQNGSGGKLHHLKLAGQGAVYRDRSIVADRKLARRNRDSALRSHDQLAFRCRQMPIAIGMKISVAGVKAPTGALHREPAFPLQGKVEIAAGSLQTALPGIHPTASQDAKIVHGLGDGIGPNAGIGAGQMRSEGWYLSLISGGIDIRQIVRRQIERLGTRQQASARRVESTIHGVLLRRYSCKKRTKGREGQLNKSMG